MILASNSPRRKEILELLGFNLKIIPANINEKSDKKEILERIEDIAYKKALFVAKENKTDFVLAADTIVELEGEILGKPKDDTEVFSYLRKLSGKTHRVITAYSLINIEKNIYIKESSISEVEFYSLRDDEIKWYIETKEPFDKAGAYGIQGKGRVFVKKINGDFYSIMGFPVSQFLKTLEEIGYKINNINKI